MHLQACRVNGMENNKRSTRSKVLHAVFGPGSP